MPALQSLTTVSALLADQPPTVRPPRSCRLRCRSTPARHRVRHSSKYFSQPLGQFKYFCWRCCGGGWRVMAALCGGPGCCLLQVIMPLSCHYLHFTFHFCNIFILIHFCNDLQTQRTAQRLITAVDPVFTSPSSGCKNLGILMMPLKIYSKHLLHKIQTCSRCGLHFMTIFQNPVH